MAHKVPGRQKREGISLTARYRKFPDDATAEAWFAAQRWGDTPACPHCGSLNVQSGAKHNTMPYRCREKECAKRFSVKTGTAMQASNLGYQVWAIAIYLVATNIKGVSSMKLHRDLEITLKLAWHLDRYVGEFAGRHNQRKFNTAQQMAAIAAGMQGKWLRYQDLIADTGMDSKARLA